MLTQCQLALGPVVKQEETCDLSTDLNNEVMTSAVQPIKEREHCKMVTTINGFLRLGQTSNCSIKKSSPQILSFITSKYEISFQLLILFALTGNYMEKFLLVF